MTEYYDDHVGSRGTATLLKAWRMKAMEIPSLKLYVLVNRTNERQLLLHIEMIRLLPLYAAVAALPQQIIMATTSSIPSMPTPFSSDFHQPAPPLIKPEFKANWNQHKWNENVSHIASGYMYNSPTHKKVRVDEAFDSVFASSLFDYSNVTDQGVANILWELKPAITSPPQFFVGYTEPAFPLIPDDILVTSNAVYAGVRTDSYVGDVVAWNFFYGSQVPVTLLIDDKQVIRGYDYWAPNERTYAITRLFNIVVGQLPADLFDFPQPS